MSDDGVTASNRVHSVVIRGCSHHNTKNAHTGRQALLIVKDMGSWWKAMSTQVQWHKVQDTVI